MRENENKTTWSWIGRKVGEDLEGAGGGNQDQNILYEKYIFQ